MPSKEGKWFIRPHHVETLTMHPQSVKDDVLNTRYFSNYQTKDPNQRVVDPTKEAIASVEA